MIWKRWHTVATAILATLALGTMSGRSVLGVALWFYNTDIAVAANTETNEQQDTTDENISEAIKGIKDILEKQETDAEMLRRHEEFCRKHNLTPKQCADY